MTLYEVVVKGDTVVEAVTAPLLQMKEEPGIFEVTDRVLEPPLQIVVFVALTLTIGKGFTVIVIPAVPVHPEAVVPVTVYEVVDVGETIIEEFEEPVDHTKAVPATVDVAVRVLLAPSQILSDEAFILMTGVGFTVMVIVAVPVQPFVLVPVTVYVVVTAGLTFILLLLAPLLQ